MSFLASPERDEALRRLVEDAAGGADLWSVAALRRAAGPEADLLFPGGAPEMVEVWADRADRALLARAEADRVAALPRVSARVRAAVLLRLPANEAERDAARRALAVLALPGQQARALRVLGRTVDALWRAAGDTTAGFSRHTKRLTLAGVWSATLLYALGRGDRDRSAATDASPDASGLDPTPASDAVAAFLDRRLAGVARIGRVRSRLTGGGVRPAR